MTSSSTRITTTPALLPNTTTWKTQAAALLRDTPQRAAHHHAALGTLLLDPAVEQAGASEALAQLTAQYRRERLIIAEAHKERHRQQLAEEVAAINRKVADLHAYVEKEVANLRPAALKKVVAKYEKVLARATGGGGRGDGSHFSLVEEEEDEGAPEAARRRPTTTHEGGEEENDGGLYALSPPSSVDRPFGKRVSPATPALGASSLGSKTKKAKGLMGGRREGRAIEEELVKMVTGTEEEGGGGEWEETMATEVIATLNQKLLQAQLTKALAASQRKMRQEMEAEWKERLESMVKSGVECARQEMALEWESLVEEERKRVRVMAEVEKDALVEKLEEQHKEEMAKLMKSVGL